MAIIKTDNTKKPEVFNSADLLYPVGAELRDIIEINNIDIQLVRRTLNTDQSIETISRFSKKNLHEIESITNLKGISIYLSSFQDLYKQKKDKAEKSYKIYKAIYKEFAYVINLTLSKFNSGIDKLNDFADFLGVEDEKNIRNSIKEKAALYKITGQGVDDIALFVWKRRGEVLFKDLNLPSYKEDQLKNWVEAADWKKNLNNPSYFKNIPSIFKEMGVGVILDPFVKKTVYGYVDWIEGNPLIQVSDRGKNLAICWYTLFHEIGHVLLHKNNQIFEGDLNLSKSRMSKIEQEANDFAFKYLFNGRGLQGYIFGHKQYYKSLSEDKIMTLASQFNVDPMFVSLWLQKAGMGNYITNKYISHIEFDYNQ